MTAPAHQGPDVLETATDWFARRRSGEMTAAEAQALEAWLAASSFLGVIPAGRFFWFRGRVGAEVGLKGLRRRMRGRP